MRLTLLLLFFGFLQVQTLTSQVKFSVLEHNFGDLLSESSRYVDIAVSNKGQKKVLVFSIRKSKEVTSLISKKRIAPDSTSTIRLQVNPTKKGPFSYNVAVFTNDKNEATNIKLTGNMQEFDANSNHLFTACPTFSEKPRGTNPQAFQLTVVTIDKDTKEKLKESTVTLVQKGVEVWTNETDKRGEVKLKASLGRSYFVAKHLGYYPTDLGQYINFKRNLIVLEMSKDTTTAIMEQIPTVENPVDEVTVVKVETKTESFPVVSTTPLPKTIHDLPSENFDDEYFNAINVIFVLDISSSMRQADKIELMKYSLMQLSEMLRKQDKFSIVSYASNSNVVLPPTTGDSKEQIQTSIKNLEAKGFTSGSKGIELGYETAFGSQILGGSNHVVVITDGAFNQDSKGYLRHIKKFKRNGITLSVVGIKSKTKEEDELLTVANLGGGRYVPIHKLSDAQQNLKQEIRIASFKE